jgi:hypothetical protein
MTEQPDKADPDEKQYSVYVVGDRSVQIIYSTRFHRGSVFVFSVFKGYEETMYLAHVDPEKVAALHGQALHERLLQIIRRSSTVKLKVFHHVKR